MVPQSQHVREISRVEHPMSRYLPDVIDLVLGEIPIEYSTLIAELRKLRDTALYTPPECMGPLWGRLARGLTESLGDVPSSDWEKRIAAIIRNEPVAVVEHLSHWRERFCTDLRIAQATKNTVFERELLRALIQRALTTEPQDIEEWKAAARYAVGE